MLEKQNRKDWGITPDVEVKLSFNEKKEMINVQNANEVLVKADHNDKSEPVKRYSRKETIEADPQLAVALMIIKAKMIKATVE